MSPKTQDSTPSFVFHSVLCSRTLTHLITCSLALWLLAGFAQWRGSHRRVGTHRRAEGRMIPSLQGPFRSQVLSGGPLHRAHSLPKIVPSLTPQALSGRTLAASTPRALHYPSISPRPRPSSHFECATCFQMGPRLTGRPKPLNAHLTRQCPVITTVLNLLSSITSKKSHSTIFQDLLLYS